MTSIGVMSILAVENWDPMPILYWLAVIVIVSVVIGLIAFWLYRRTKSQWTEDRSQEPLSLDALQAMRDAGELSDEEFKQLRNALVRRSEKQT